MYNCVCPVVFSCCTKLTFQETSPRYYNKSYLLYCFLFSSYLFLLLDLTALWRFTFSLSIVYELGLIFFLFQVFLLLLFFNTVVCKVLPYFTLLQTADDARKLLKHFDPKLGEPLEERSYGGNCKLYDEDTPENPWHNILDKFDVFVPTHFFGDYNFAL